jgi:hypothetical protein
MSVEAVGRTADAVEMTLSYELEGYVWHHSFAVAPMSEVEIEGLLSQCGFGSFVWSGRQNRWASAVVQ